MEPVQPLNHVSLQLPALLISGRSVYQLVRLDQAEVVLAKNYVLYLLPQWLRQSHKDLTCTDDMLALLPLLGKLYHFLHGDRFTFQAVKLKMDLINEIQHTSKAIRKVAQRLDTVIRYRSILIASNRDVRAKQALRISVQDLTTVLHRRERLAGALGAAEDEQPFRVEILRVLAAEVKLVFDTAVSITRVYTPLQ